MFPGNVFHHCPVLAAPAPVYSWIWNVSERASCLQLQPLLLHLSQININHLFHTGKLFILFSIADLRWEMFPGCCLPAYFLLFFFLFFLFTLFLCLTGVTVEGTSSVQRSEGGCCLPYRQKSLGKGSFCYDAFHSKKKEVGSGPLGVFEVWKHRPVWSGTPRHEIKLY